MSKLSFSDIQNPLFLHPSDSATSISLDKLQGAADYRSWRRSMEINLSAKRKMGFVTGATLKDTEDEVKSELWDICNNMVIAWIHHNVSPAIKKSILYIKSAKDVWNQLEIRFSLTHGSRKYRLNKDLYETKQNVGSINDYYTALSVIWEELESINMLPDVTTMTDDVKKLVEAIDQQKEESRLFQFLNGLNDKYGPQRSQILMMSPLPTVESACAVLQQEESQREVLKPVKNEVEMSAMYVKSQNDKMQMTCQACGVKGHLTEKCWTVVGYPKWHSRHGKGIPRNPVKDQVGTSSHTPKWNAVKNNYPKMAASAQRNESGVLFTQQQLDQIAKMLPGLLNQQTGKTTDTDDELDVHFSSMISCHQAAELSDAWIVDSGASDHMTPHLHCLTDVDLAKGGLRIN